MSEAAVNESMAERVYRLIREDIIVGDMAPGQAFNEAALVERFEVSTSPLREALSRLRQDGLIRVLPRKGYTVTELTLNDFHELFQMRLILESSAAELAAPRTTADHIEQLTRLSAVEITADNPESRKHFMKANQDFHLLIAEIGGNRRLHTALRQSFQDIQRILFTNIGESDGQTNAADHAPIIDALARRDASDARAASIAHIHQARDRIIHRMITRFNELSLDPLDL
ncbi:GntR family transcriptional regulator [Rhodococcus sp. ACT016]|uniref:GntR family transcriptional regulator n=1 Tax=Rhodococcus sp. ACT016 TaxID=3134808 RepID=UPI003D2AC737